MEFKLRNYYRILVPPLPQDSKRDYNTVRFVEEEELSRRRESLRGYDFLEDIH